MLLGENLTKIYKQRTVVNDVTISIKPGEIVGLLGPNGAGKSTSFYMIAGLIKPDIGKIFLNGHDVTELSLPYRAKMGIAYLPQEGSIFRNMSVEENILVGLDLIESDDTKKAQRLNEILSMFSIEHLRLKRATTLSGGEKRRVEIARCITISPQYLLLDEPLAGIDPIAVSGILEIIRLMKSRNIGVLITDHNVRDTLEIVDQACIICDGRILAYDNVESIKKDQRVRNSYLGN